MSASPDFFSVTVSHKRSGNFAGQSREPTVIWLTGEHDVSNASRLSKTIAETIALDDEDVIIDLSGVSFMGGATIAVFSRANAFLVARSRALVLRSPRRYAIRLLGLCGLSALISPPPTDAVVMSQAGALRTWVDVPTEERERLRKSDSKPPVPARVDVSTSSEVLVALNDAEGPNPGET